ncbi:hypothetical protein GCM10010191_20010 [Actinomadura vinacea]|uniref:Lantibiotic dehydratase N-terminal domain-containing protein n=2 Tax=Actinomadura vinacea TaxID=115336 RepID=A0ABP5VV95_9ACTN
MAGVQSLLECFLRPMLRVFRTSLDICGSPIVDPASDGVVFELTPAHLPTGRILVAEPPRRHDARPTRLTTVDTLVDAFIRAGLPADERTVRRQVAAVIAAELRYLRPDSARELAGRPCWSPYVHSVSPEQEAILQRIVDRVREQASARRAGVDVPAPVVRVSPNGCAAAKGFTRFRGEIFHLGGRLQVGSPSADSLTADPPEATVCEVAVGRAGGDPDAPVPTVATFERAPATWRRPWARGPHISHATSLAGLRLGELRENPLGEQFAVHWDRPQTTGLVSRLVAAASRAAEHTADRAVAVHPHATPGTDTCISLTHHILQRDQFRAGPRSDYRLDDARADLLPAMSRGEPLHLCMLFFPNKLGHGGLKAAGMLPDLAELATLVRMLELVEALRRVYPPGVARFSLLSDGEHFRRHPRARVGAGIAKMQEYARQVAGDLFQVHDLDTVTAESMSGPARSGYSELRTRVRRSYNDLFRGLDITADPVAVLCRVAELDPARNAADLFRSLVYSVPIPESARAAGFSDPTGSAWARALYDDIYDVGADVEPVVRRARQQVLRTTWEDMLSYASVLRADQQLGVRRRVFPEALWLTTRPSRGRPAFGPLGHGPAPWHATGAVDSRGAICHDFLVALRDQGFVPLFTPLLGRRQPFAMVPITATRVGADGLNELRPDFIDSIRLRPR